MCGSLGVLICWTRSSRSCGGIQLIGRRRFSHLKREAKQPPPPIVRQIRMPRPHRTRRMTAEKCLTVPGSLKIIKTQSKKDCVFYCCQTTDDRQWFGNTTTISNTSKTIPIATGMVFEICVEPISKMALIGGIERISERGRRRRSDSYWKYDELRESGRAEIRRVQPECIFEMGSKHNKQIPNNIQNTIPKAQTRFCLLYIVLCL